MGLFNWLNNSYKSFMGLYESPINQNMFVDNVQKGVDTDLIKSEPVREQKALLENPLGTLQAMSYKDKPFSLTYDMLRRMTTTDAVVGAIINTRINQVSAFSQPARFKRDGIGFEIHLRNQEVEPSEEDKEVILALETFLENTGYEKDPYRDSFDTFIRKIVRDRLTFDQIATEIVPDAKGRPAEFYALDSATIRIATESIKDTVDLAEMSVKKSDEVKFVQVIDGTIRACFTGNELAFGVANPRTDIEMFGYGFSELEMLVHQVTSHLWAEQYNSKFFSQGGTTKGILNFKGSNNQPVNPEQLEAFKRQWLAQVSGMTGAWKTPVVSVEGLEYINVSQSNREMEFEKWLNYLINICCAVYQIDPSEVNFPNRSGSSGSGGGLGEGGIEDRLQHSKDKGLRPLLQFIEAYINKHIVSKFDPKFVFTFVGLDLESENERAELRQKDVRTFKTVNEIREEEGLKPLENGDVILDSTFVQYLGQLAQQEQMSQMGDMSGMPGEMSGGMTEDEEGYEDESNSQSESSDEEYNYDTGDNEEEGEQEDNEDKSSNEDYDDYDTGDDEEEGEQEDNEEDTEKSLKFIRIEIEK